MTVHKNTQVINTVFFYDLLVAGRILVFKLRIRLGFSVHWAEENIDFSTFNANLLAHSHSWTLSSVHSNFRPKLQDFY
jgi:hypothetical protein